MEKSVKVILTCPVCRGTNLLPAKTEANIPQSFECIDCKTMFSIIKPQIIGYEISPKENEKKEKRRKTLAEILDGILLGWILKR